MALWQISFFIVTKKSLEAYPLPAKDEEGLFDDSNYWIEDFDLMLFDVLNDFLPKGESWSRDIVMYGNLESNVFEIGTNAHRVESVSFRIDFTSDYEDILRGIIEFCILNNLAILTTTDLEIVSLNFESVNQHIIKSPQVIRYNSFLYK